MSVVSRTLGQDQVLVEGRAVHWPSRAARDMFYLLLISPHGHTKTEIIELLWGDAPGSDSTSNFKVTQFRLRQSLGDQGATVERGGRYALAPAYYAQADHVQFLEALERPASQPREERLAQLDRAFALYGGDFLPDHTTEWAEDTRNTLRAAYVQARLEVAQTHCTAVECHSAVRNLAVALAAEPLLGEHFHQDIMTCLCTLHRPDDALSHYRHFLTYIQRDIGDTPSLQTMQLADHIRNGQPHVSRHIGASLPCPRRMLYGDAHLEVKPLPQLDPALLERSLTRGRQLVDLIRSLGGVREWPQLAGLVEQFLTSELRGHFVWLVPANPAWHDDAALQQDSLKADWPEHVRSAMTLALSLTLSDGVVSSTDVRQPHLGAVHLGVHPVRRDNGPTLGWICIARPDQPPPRGAPTTELVNGVVAALTFILSTAQWAATTVAGPAIIRPPRAGHTPESDQA